MKRFILHTLLFILAINMVLGQTIPSSNKAANCSNCTPTSWNIVSGQPSVSNVTVFAVTGEVWDLPDPPSGNSRFITEKHNGSGHHDVVSTTITGLIIGRSYRVSYNVTTSDPNDPTKTGGYSIAKSASVSINSNGTIVTQTTNYSGIQDPKVSKWTHNEIVFQSKATTALLTFTGSADYIYNPASDPLSCPWPSGMICPPKYGVIGLDVEGVESICNVGNDQVVLSQSSLKNLCPATTVNLNSVLSSPPPNGLSYVWYTSQNHTGSPIDPTNVSQPGPYYAFLFDAITSCYNTNASQAKVDVTIEKCCSVPTAQVQVSKTQLTNICPSTTANLNSVLVDAPPHNTQVVWFTNANHTGTVISDPSSVGAGTYYAFLYNWTEGCFNTNASNAVVNVLLTFCQTCKAGTDQVILQSTSLKNTCPSSTVDLNTVEPVNIPPNTQLVWFDNPQHSGLPVSNESAVGAGTYYAFLFDPALDCYNTDNSSASAKVSITLCASSVFLNLKIALQGAMASSGSKQRNDLQIYAGTGLLPVQSPYGMLTSYSDINKVTGKAGTIVDWVLVEVRNGLAPGTIIQAKSLLLRTDGIVVDVNGQVPTFTAQKTPIRVVVRHRNHLPIMSKVIGNFDIGATVSYDFTTALSQASNEFDDPAQMVQKNGIWCMWAGDIANGQDLGVDATDFNAVYDTNKDAPIDIYSIADLNMDGGVDANDYNMIFSNNLIAPFSSLSNY